MDGTQMIILVLYTDDLRVPLPVLHVLFFKQIEFICQRPPYISVSRKPCDHIFPIEIIFFRSHTGKSPAVVRMHHDQVCLYSQFSKSFYTFLNVSEMCCVEPGKIPVIPHTSACIFLEVLLCEHTGIHRGSLIRIGARLTQVIVIMFRENTKPDFIERALF